MKHNFLKSLRLYALVTLVLCGAGTASSLTNSSLPGSSDICMLVTRSASATSAMSTFTMGEIYVFFILLEYLFAVNDVDAFLHLVHALTCKVVDGLTIDH